MIADTQDRFLGNRVAAPAERLKAREELEERQGPDQIVVAAGPLATDFVVDFPERAKDQEGRGDAAIAQLADHRNAIDVGSMRSIVITAQSCAAPWLGASSPLEAKSTW
jgi:hypothetical protein